MKIERKDVQQIQSIFAALGDYFNIVKWLHENTNEVCIESAITCAPREGDLYMVI